MPNWGGEERGNYLKKHLSDIFTIDLTNEMEIKNNNYEIDQTYDLYYLAHHTMLARGFTERVPSGKIVAMVTVRKVVTNIFKNARPVHDKEMTHNEYIASLAKHCRAIFYNNLLCKEEVKFNFAGIPRYYTPRGVDETIFIEKKPPPPLEKFTLCHVGKRIPEKGLDDFIIPSAEKAKCRLIYNTRIWDDALPKNKMCNFYNNCNAYVISSIMDGTPNTALEAAACGRPIISNRIGNMPEFIKDGYNGFLVKRDVEEYADKMRWMKNNYDKTVEMGKNARKTIEEGWTWRHSMEYERKAFKSVLEV